MTALFEKIVVKKDESFFIGIFQDNLEKSSWHYHNNYEISFKRKVRENGLWETLWKNFNRVTLHLSAQIFLMYGLLIRNNGCYPNELLRWFSFSLI
jgi:hypothetical protein